jgi:ssDNA-binding Zn-finger/Zn-ribbon topoisomerase 1
MDKQALVNLLANGYSTHQIATLTGRCQSNVMYWLVKHGLSIPNKKQDIRVCKNCGGDVIKLASNTGQYCSNTCQGEFEIAQRVAGWLAGEYKQTPEQTPVWIRRHMLEVSNCECSICKWAERHPDDKLPLVEIDHIDGDGTNHAFDNLRVLCPNCHSMTSTFRNRNKNSTRISRSRYS